MTTKEDLKRQLAEAGILPGDTVMIHSSLKSIGPIEGGADGLIDAFSEYLREGLLLIPTHTWRTVHRTSPVFDSRTEVPCIGVLPAVAAARRDGVRSLHPTHSIMAFGCRAEEFVAGEERCATPMAAGGCWSRLYDEDSKILLVGVGHQRNTYIHAIEERADIPHRLTEDAVPFLVIDREGRRLDRPMPTMFTPGTVDVSLNFVRVSDHLEKAGATYRARIGSAETIVCSARAMSQTLMPLFVSAREKGIDLFADEH